MIIDCFPYFNEAEMLELRLTMLYEHVDLFVITEGDHTHRGIPKPCTAYETIQRLGFSFDKIRIVTVSLPNSSQEPDNWVRERMQRNAAAEYINHGDVAFVSDCDEIINPELIKEYANHVMSNPGILLRVPLVYLNGSAEYRVHTQNGDPVLWPSPFFCMKHHLEKYTLSDIREDRALNMNSITEFMESFPIFDSKYRDSGWHFTWMGGKRRIHVKHKNFLHNEFALSNNFTPRAGGLDTLDRVDHVLQKYPLENLPKEVFQLERVNKFLFPDYASNMDDPSRGIFNLDIDNNINMMYEQDILPKEHIEYLESLEISPKIIYDIGSCVLYWERHARRIWPTADIYLFDASQNFKKLYNKTNQKYHLGILTDVDGKIVKFYEDPMKPTGSSYYKENTIYYDERHAIHKAGITLDQVVEENRWPKPDLIKLDIQGAEMDVLKGAVKCLESCKDIILESQHIEYNLGAPMASDVIDFMKSIGFELVSNFSKQKVDGDYHFRKIL